ncbi:uncharacterized protein si:dkey-87o1.2 isoform X1 [Triplophysa dalaica]|uniref:uncharacterized protein si:dkey-87o1.2 isoform X1 n=1 Tax=Triplophysa dalaica TaxID=1582913 RepID=UPI0024DFE2A6|nr:uncharacterized protein si:dkey-87o1.2 isoform X1 [Triplophysa dalaica]
MLVIAVVKKNSILPYLTVENVNRVGPRSQCQESVARYRPLTNTHPHTPRDIQSYRMRAVSAMIFLAVCALMVIVYQAIQQELNIRNQKTSIVVSNEQVKLKEDGIVSVKMQIDDMNKKIAPLAAQRDQLKKQKEDQKKLFAQSEKDLGTCKSEKDNLEKKRTEASNILQKIKEGHEAEWKKAEQEIEDLKHKILDRDLKICEFVDLKVEETRMLCAGAKL